MYTYHFNIWLNIELSSVVKYLAAINQLNSYPLAQQTSLEKFRANTAIEMVNTPLLNGLPFAFISRQKQCVRFGDLPNRNRDTWIKKKIYTLIWHIVPVPSSFTHTHIEY